jgi:hypothetical protein
MSIYYTCSIITNSQKDKTSLKENLFSYVSQAYIEEYNNISDPPISIDPDDGFSKISLYKLTKDTILLLKKDPRIKDIELIPSIEDLEDDSDESFIGGNYNGFIPGFSPTSQSTNPALVYHTSSPSLLYSGSKGITTYNIFTASLNFENYNYTLDGTGVDLIVMDGAFCHKHADFYDFDGNSRVQYIDWYEVTGKSGVMPKYFYVNESNPSLNHGTWCMSLAGGLAHGFAKGAKLYPMRVNYTSLTYGTGSNGSSFNLLEALDLIKRFHVSKSIDPTTGYKRPTVVSISLKFDTTIYASIYNIKAPGPVSTSFQPPLQNNTGIRFNIYNKDYNFISSSIYNDTLNVTINNYPNAADFYYYTGSIHNLANKINSLQYPFVTCSVNGTSLNVTTSFYYGLRNSYNQRQPLYIYTGSRNQLLGSSLPYGGYHVSTLFDTSSNSNGIQGGVTHITKIVVGGVDQNVTGNDNYVKLNHGLIQNPPYDHFGIDNGSNNNWAYRSSNPNYTSIDIYSPTIDSAMEELAEAGVVIVQAGGNRSLYSSNTGSEDNPFFTSDSYSNLLAETYIEKDVDTGTLWLANTPIYLYRSQPSNGSVIQVGLLNFYNSSLSFEYISSPSSPFTPMITTQGNTGPAIDIYAGGNNCWAANITNSLASPVHYLYQNINFKTQSVENYLDTHFPDAQNYINPTYPNNPKLTTQIGNGTGGTSASCPIVAGIICLYLQLNPWADVKQVRKWLRTHPKLIPNINVDINEEFLYKRHLKFNPPGGSIGYTSSIDTSGSIQLGIDGDGPIVFFPMTSNQMTFSNVKITKT